MRENTRTDEEIVIGGMFLTTTLLDVANFSPVKLLVVFSGWRCWTLKQ